jgi:antitoxin component YwqK of YwqJK toxin-antitoxin module
MENYSDGLEHGLSITYWNDGDTQYQTYSHGQRCGLSRFIGVNDEIIWSEYCGEVRNGLLCQWGTHGGLEFMGFYKDGKCHGRTFSWYLNGKLYKACVMHHGTIVKSMTYDEIGQLIE